MSLKKSDYFKGVDESTLSPLYVVGCEDLIEKVNGVLARFYKLFPSAPKREISSGFRTWENHLRIYKQIAFKKGIEFDINAVPKASKHLCGQALDLTDGDDLLGNWVMRTPEILIEFNLYLEDKRATDNWVHFQSVPPASKKRIFKP